MTAGLARVLELPATAWLRRYRVRAMGRVDQAALDRLSNGITIEGVHYGPIEATLEREQGANVWLMFAIREGKNREVRKVLRRSACRVNRLIRVAFGPFMLGELADGEAKEIETAALRAELGRKDCRAGWVPTSTRRWSSDDERRRATPRQSAGAAARPRTRSPDARAPSAAPERQRSGGARPRN